MESEFIIADDAPTIDFQNLTTTNFEDFGNSGGIEKSFTNSQNMMNTFGGGGEIHVDMTDIENLAGPAPVPSGQPANKPGIFGGFFNNIFGNKKVPESPRINPATMPGSADPTMDFSNGFGGGKNTGGHNAGMNMPLRSEEEIRKRKLHLLNRFARFRSQGIRVDRDFDMTSDLHEMEEEFERIDSQRDLAESVDFMRKAIMFLVSGLEKANKTFNPFDIELDGWKGTVRSELDTTYDDIFIDLYEKYKGNNKWPPELRLISHLALSGFMYHSSNALLKNSKIPGIDEILKNNPDLARSVMESTVNQMKETSGTQGFGSFMGELMKNTGMNHSAPSMPGPASTRREMTGPGDIDSLLNMANNISAQNVRQNFETVDTRADESAGSGNFIGNGVRRS